MTDFVFEEEEMLYTVQRNSFEKLRILSNVIGANIN